MHYFKDIPLQLPQTHRYLYLHQIHGICVVWVIRAAADTEPTGRLFLVTVIIWYPITLWHDTCLAFSCFPGVSEETHQMLEQALCLTELHGAAPAIFISPGFLLLLSPFLSVIHLLLSWLKYTIFLPVIQINPHDHRTCKLFPNVIVILYLIILQLRTTLILTLILKSAHL